MSELFDQPSKINLKKNKLWSAADLERNLQSDIYCSSNDKLLTVKNWVWRVGFKWDFGYTFAYPEKVWEIYQEQWVPVFECDNWEQATSHLKEYFDSYKDDCIELWKLDNWKSIPKNSAASFDFSRMMHEWSWDLHMPYLWYMKRWDTYLWWQKRSKNNETFATYVPLTIEGKPIRIRNVGMASRVSLDTPDDRACLITLFRSGIAA